MRVKTCSFVSCLNSDMLTMRVQSCRYLLIIVELLKTFMFCCLHSGATRGHGHTFCLLNYYVVNATLFALCFHLSHWVLVQQSLYDFSQDDSSANMNLMQVRNITVYFASFCYSVLIISIFLVSLFDRVFDFFCFISSSNISIWRIKNIIFQVF